VIATQEPTLSPQLIDLCNVCIVHRFNSPAWFQILKHHLAGASTNQEKKDASTNNLFEKIVALRTGEAFVFCPTALLDVHDGNVFRLQHGFIRIKIRARCSTDGGKSIMASDKHSVVNVNSRPVSTVVRPYTRPPNAMTTRGFSGGRPANSVARPVTHHTMPSTVMQPTPPPSQRPTPATTIPAAVPYTTEPAGSSAYHQQQFQVDQNRVLEALRAEVFASLRENPCFISHEKLRMSVVDRLNLSRKFFQDAQWLKVSREVIRIEVVSLMLY
jgi:hypothetical protein